MNTSSLSIIGTAPTAAWGKPTPWQPRSSATNLGLRSVFAALAMLAAHTNLYRSKNHLQVTTEDHGLSVRSAGSTRGKPSWKPALCMSTITQCPFSGTAICNKVSRMYLLVVYCLLSGMTEYLCRHRQGKVDMFHFCSAVCMTTMCCTSIL